MNVKVEKKEVEINNNSYLYFVALINFKVKEYVVIYIHINRVATL